MMDITQDMYDKLLEERNELLEDLKTTKNNIYKLLEKIGIIRDDGTVSENINFIKISSLLGSIMSGKLKEDLHFLKELLPLVEKYKHL